MISGRPTKVEKRPDCLEEPLETLGVRASSDNVGDLRGRSGCNCINVSRGVTGLGKAELLYDLVELGFDPLCVPVEVAGNYPCDCIGQGHFAPTPGHSLAAQDYAVFPQ